MKLTKRFLMFAAIAGALVFPATVYAGDSDADHGWMRAAPNDELANASTVGKRTDNNLRRNQTLYWAIEGASGLPNVIDTSLSTPAKAPCTIDTDCSSAPLFISAPSAIVCIDTDIDETTSGQTEVNMRICSDSTCTDNTSIDGDNLAKDSSSEPGAGGYCEEFSGAGTYDGFNVGSTWVYIEVTDAPANGATSLIWIIGN